ncbi:glycosyltransferase family 2 protein [Amycolatopsis orientalis]|uniref:glycosyltransferase family 2 protein n=1 Tax=Amycolatopsis orientalis TaxID=31958 RepID=UPI0004063F7F|nr:glycosyltransferase family 2 protein [Amycolatopsis orientalis]
MSTAPRLSIGVPVYNGEDYLAEALDALLGQTYENFELIISDNASTDHTEEISREYAKQDPRVRYVRQPVNIGCAPNHNYCVDVARGELFKWGSDDDLYARDLLERCIEALDEHPEFVLSHSWTAMIDEKGVVTQALKYPLNTVSPHAAERFRSTLFATGGDDDGAVIRTEVLRRVAPLDSYHHADRTIISELALHGPFHQVPDWLYFRRDHPGRSEHEYPTVRKRASNLDPKRADKLRHPMVRLLGEYVLGYVNAIRNAPITGAEKRECFRYLRQWLLNRAGNPAMGRMPVQAEAELGPREVSVLSVVAGQEGRVP